MIPVLRDLRAFARVFQPRRGEGRVDEPDAATSSSRAAVEPKVVLPWVQPVVDVPGNLYLDEQHLGWANADGAVDVLQLEYVKVQQHIDRVISFLHLAVGTDDAAVVRVITVQLVSPSPQVVIPVANGVSIAGASNSTAQWLVLSGFQLPPGDWRMRVNINALTGGNKILLRYMTTVTDLGEVLKAPPMHVVVDY